MARRNHEPADLQPIDLVHVRRNGLDHRDQRFGDHEVVANRHVEMAEVAGAGKTCRADVEKQCSTERRRIQKVACIRDAINNFGDDCKAAIAAVVTRKK
jgi:hypothetical protein